MKSAEIDSGSGVKRSRGWIGVDLDGTLAQYDGWKDASHIGPPIGPMRDRVLRWLKEGIEVRIFTARVHPGDNGDRRNQAVDADVAIRGWCLEHIGIVLPVTCSKDTHMIELWDDRCVQVQPNTGLPVSQFWSHRLDHVEQPPQSQRVMIVHYLKNARTLCGSTRDSRHNELDRVNCPACMAMLHEDE